MNIVFYALALTTLAAVWGAHITHMLAMKDVKDLRVKDPEFWPKQHLRFRSTRLYLAGIAAITAIPIITKL